MYVKLERNDEPLGEIYDQIYRVVHELHPGAPVGEQALLISMMRMQARKQLGT